MWSSGKEDVAVEILNDVAKSIDIYFNTLAQLGYKKQSDVDRLLVYSFFEELLTGEMRYFITESDYRLIEQALSCLYGSSCLMPYPKYINDDSLFGHLEGSSSPRITQDSNMRYTEDYILRFKADSYNR